MNDLPPSEDDVREAFGRPQEEKHADFNRITNQTSPGEYRRRYRVLGIHELPPEDGRFPTPTIARVESIDGDGLPTDIHHIDPDILPMSAHEHFAAMVPSSYGGVFDLEYEVVVRRITPSREVSTVDGERGRLISGPGYLGVAP